ncbi:MAG TPA: mannitol dehydrogenase family protein [Lapillicoccus sp.]|uniref:mannitol dehydrogenase family protein n=1 Tax=Lapillicoccus sp. TaxID=1909287 RepID=UPI002F931808
MTAGLLAPPRYDASTIVPTVAHIGVGAFHRAHQAVYADAVLATGSAAGGITAMSLHSSQLTSALRRQGYRYLVIERGESGDRARPVTSIRDALSVPSHGLDAVLDRLTDPRVTVVTLTVTEKGYCCTAATGDLDPARPEVTHDIAHPSRPTSLPGVLVESLARRRALGIAAPTICSCDNLRANGQTTRRVVTALAAQRGGGLADWIETTVSFPSSMVDRMVPEPTDAVRQEAYDLTGRADDCAVVTEPFSAWVLEDHFPSGRPPWERVGVELVDEVLPFERAKVRILNGAHSALAYLGLLAGHSEIDRAYGDPRLREFVSEMLVHEVIPTLTPPPGVDLAAYARVTLSRFGNFRLGYTTRKVAGDGAEKLPGRILASVTDRLAVGAPVQRLGLVVAAFATCALGPRAKELGVVDPTLDRLLPEPRRPVGAAAAVEALLSVQAIFGPDMRHHVSFRDEVHRYAADLWKGDVTAAIRRSER